MNRRLSSIAAIALPLVGLMGMWASTEQWSRQGTDWLVPVEGYDPRDLLRGHYVQFRYAWPGAEEAQFNPTATVEPENYPFGGCITGTAPAIARVVRLASEADRTACPQVLAPADTTMFGTPDLPREGRLYVAQTAAGALEKQLRDPKLQGVIRVRLRSDGTVTPLELTFRPRPPQPEAELAPAADSPAR